MNEPLPSNLLTDEQPKDVRDIIRVHREMLHEVGSYRS